MNKEKLFICNSLVDYLDKEVNSLLCLVTLADMLCNNVMGTLENMKISICTRNVQGSKVLRILLCKCCYLPGKYSNQRLNKKRNMQTFLNTMPFVREKCTTQFRQLISKSARWPQRQDNFRKDPLVRCRLKKVLYDAYDDKNQMEVSMRKLTEPQMTFVD